VPPRSRCAVPVSYPETARPGREKPRRRPPQGRRGAFYGRSSKAALSTGSWPRYWSFPVFFAGKSRASGYVGVYRARGGGWEACVADIVKGKPDLILLGVYATKREAAVARAKYWKAKERAA